MSSSTKVFLNYTKVKWILRSYITSEQYEEVFVEED